MKTRKKSSGKQGNNILLVPLDSKIPNLALHKIALHHQLRGDKVYWGDRNVWEVVTWNKIYVSCLFSWNKEKCSAWKDVAEIGGSGYSLKKNLPEDIENLKPKINVGFTTRGCIRKCKFCIVPHKEGKLRIIGDLYDLWDGQAKQITLMDNNILAVPEHFIKICHQSIHKKIKLDFNQGLDARLLTDKLAKVLCKTDLVGRPRFAWDNMCDEQAVLSTISLLKQYGCNSGMFYILVGFDTTLEEDFYRLEKLKKLKQRPYLMRHRKIKGIKIYNDLAAWVNQPRFFESMTFQQYQQAVAERGKKKKKIQKKETLL